MIPFANPEMQLQLIHEQTGQLIRTAEEYRRARLVASPARRRWPWLRRYAQPAQPVPPAGSAAGSGAGSGARSLAS